MGSLSHSESSQAKVNIVSCVSPCQNPNNHKISTTTPVITNKEEKY